MVKEEAEDFYGNLAPKRFVYWRKKQKISMIIWHLQDFHF